jgi:hypothetical protein
LRVTRIETEIRNGPWCLFHASRTAAETATGPRGMTHATVPYDAFDLDNGLMTREPR